MFAKISKICPELTPVRYDGEAALYSHPRKLGVVELEFKGEMTVNKYTLTL